jgi:hypothetical protein
MEARPWDEKPSQRSRERSRKDAGRERARRSRSASVTGMRLSLSEVREGKEAVAMAAAQGRKADAAHPGGRRLKSAKRGRPLRRRLRALGKRRAVRAAEAARMLRTATEWRVAESADEGGGAPIPRRVEELEHRLEHVVEDLVRGRRRAGRGMVLVLHSRALRGRLVLVLLGHRPQGGGGARGRETRPGWRGGGAARLVVYARTGSRARPFDRRVTVDLFLQYLFSGAT